MKDLLATQIAGFALGKLLWAVLLAVLCLVVIKLVLKLLDQGLSRSELDHKIKKMIRFTVKLVLLFIAVIIIMGYLNIPVTSLVAVLSVAGLAVSLAVQNFLGNVAGGVQLIASKPFQEGDFVECGGCSGTVQDMGLFYTKLLTPDNKLIQLPNSAVIGATITNYSSQPTRRVEHKVSASYDAPVELVEKTLLGLIRSTPGTLSDPAPTVRVSNYGDNAIEYVVRVWCASADFWDVYFDLLDGMKPAFDRAGIEMTYPHVNVHMVKE